MLDGGVSLAALRTFAVVAEQQSLSRAADVLCISQSAVSHQMKLLEQQLNQSLFVRRHRGIKLTEAGRQLASHASMAMAQLQHGLDKVRLSSQQQSLRVAVIPSFASCWLMPRLGDFYQRYPDIALHLIAQDALADFQTQQVDLHIHFGKGHYIGLETEFLMYERAVPVCGEMLKPPEDMRDWLPKQRLLHYDAGSEDRPGGLDWTRWLTEQNFDASQFRQHSWFSHVALAVQAAEQGLGVALGWHSVIYEGLSSGRLIRCGEDSERFDYGYYLVKPEGHNAEPIELFSKWLLQQVRIAPGH